MNNKILFSLLIVVILAAIGAGVWLANQHPIKQPPVENHITEAEQTNHITLQEARGEIARIFSDDSIDISTWPTYTNTKYGWSIVYPPQAEWQPNSMTETIEEASGPSAYLGGQRIIRIDSEFAPIGVHFGAFKEYTSDSNEYDMALRQIQPHSNIGFGNIDTLDFWALSADNDTRIFINFDQREEQPLRDQLIKSLSTFKFVNE